MNSYHPKSLLNDLQYYITPPHDCSYLEKSQLGWYFSIQHIVWMSSRCLNFLGWVFAGVVILSTAQSVIYVDSAYLAAYLCANLK